MQTKATSTLWALRMANDPQLRDAQASRTQASDAQAMPNVDTIIGYILFSSKAH
jgi:hypothetical protein